MTTGQYKTFKGLTKENLRDNMTSVEVALNTLAEASTRELSRQRNPKGFGQSKRTAEEGGVRWNFTKFLISKDGSVIKRYAPVAKPEDMEADIEAMLK